MFTTVFLSPTTNARASAHIPLRTARFSNKNSVVGMGTGVRIPAGELLSSIKVQTGYGVHPACYSMGNRSSSPGVKRLERQVHHTFI